jgi:hypothetical protein
LLALNIDSGIAADSAAIIQQIKAGADPDAVLQQIKSTVFSVGPPYVALPAVPVTKENILAAWKQVHGVDAPDLVKKALQ